MIMGGLNIELDKSDIESLGFEKLDENIYHLKLNNINYQLNTNLESKKNNLRLIKDEDGKLDQLFIGYIKNISELEILLKQLNIAE